MSFLTDQNSTSVRDNTLIEIIGADGTAIGNTSDRLKVDSSGSSITISGTVTTASGKEAFLEYSSYSPDPGDYPLQQSFVSGDYSDQMKVRGQVLTDEGSFRDDFDLKKYPSGVLYRTLTGTVGFKNNNTSLGGSGTAYITEMKSGQYVKKSTDAETLWTQIDYFDGDNSAFFTTLYQGSTQNTTGVISDWKTLTPSGASITTSSSTINIAPGTTNGNLCGIIRQGDYLPYTLSFKALLSQRIANQTTTIGFQDDYTTTNFQAVFIFDGTSNTTVKCRSSSSTASSDIEETSVTIPSGNTASYHKYSILPTQTGVRFLIDGTEVAFHENHMPGAYDSMQIVSLIKNTATVSATTLTLDWITFSNQNQVEITNGFNEPFLTKPAPKPSTYGATVIGLSAANNATDIFTITGSASKTIKIKKILITATQTTGSAANIILLKRSTTNTGGTSTNPTAVSFDSNNAAATATLNAYTVNPSALGTLVGNLCATKLFIPATTGSPGQIEIHFGANNNQELTLRGTSQVFSVNLNSTTLAGNSFNICIEWTEET